VKKQTIRSNSPYEDQIGFSRACRIGNIIAISGTAPILDDGSTAYPGNMYQQTIRCLEIIDNAIHNAGSSRETVIRTRMFLTDASFWKEAAQAHGEFFRGINPASTMVVVKGFLREDWMIEIEADCIISE
jgi:enamine deaminase RidA (YjgF/YER057c/UK114 family)